MTTMHTATKAGTQTGTLMPPADTTTKAAFSREDGYSKDGWCSLKASDPIYGDILDFLIDEPRSSTTTATSSGWTASPTTSSTRCLSAKPCTGATAMASMGATRIGTITDNRSAYE